MCCKNCCSLSDCHTERDRKNVIGLALQCSEQWRRQDLVRGGKKLRENNVRLTHKILWNWESCYVPENAKYAMLFLLERQPRGVECQSLCGSEVTWKLNKVGSPGPVPYSWRHQWFWNQALSWLPRRMGSFELQSTGYSALPSPPRLMRRAVAARWIHTRTHSVTPSVTIPSPSFAKRRRR